MAGGEKVDVVCVVLVRRVKIAGCVICNRTTFTSRVWLCARDPSRSSQVVLP